MKIDDKEIEKLLQDFSGEDIEVPKELDEKLKLKLEELKPRKNKTWSVKLVASILILIMSYIFVPSFQTFANTAFKYIFGDVGVENAVNFGYKGQANQRIKIAGYDILIENIYIDDLRISFDAVINDDMDGEENQYSLYVDGENFESISVADGLFTLEDNKLKANVQVIGDGVSKLIKDKDKLELDLKLVKHFTYYEDQEELDDKELGSSKLILDIDKHMKPTKEISINEAIKKDNLNFNIEKLQTSPTMMYLDTYGNLEGVGETEGLYNFSIISDNGEIYKDKMMLSAVGKENGWRQTLVPSIYYDKSNSFRLKAEGVLVAAKQDIQINLNDTYPKKIKYFDTTITINKVEYKDNKLIVEIKQNDRIYGIGSGNTSVDGVESNSAYYSSDEIYCGYEFDIDKKENYNFKLGLTLKYRIPIDVEIKNR